MFRLFYDFLLISLAISNFPKFLWQWLIKGKYSESLKERLGFKLPQLPPNAGRPIIWIHTVSVGETRAVIPLYKKIREELPEATVVVSSVTETGHTEAKRSLPEAAIHFFLPLDFSWTIRKTIRQLRPDILILVESDFWYNLLAETKKIGAGIVLVNGKISERSTKRFSKVKFFAKKLFSNIDILCLQSEGYKKRFMQIGVDPQKLIVTGNLKLDVISKKLSKEEKNALKQDLGIPLADPVLVIGSTHDTEEAELLKTLETVWKEFPNLKVVLVPRHPERFPLVEKIIQKYPYLLYSKRAEKKGGEKVVLIDAMGLLHRCYQIADVAIVAGSFTDKVGGHNIFEPIECGVPTFFGPNMFSQPDLTELILDNEAGVQATLEELPKGIITILKDPEPYRKRALNLASKVHGTTESTWKAIFPFINMPE